VFDNPAEFEDEDDDVDGDDDGQRGSDSEEEGAPSRKKGRVHMNDRNVLNMSDNFAGYNSVKVPPKGKKLSKPSNEWYALFEYAMDEGLSVGCGNCLWSVAASDLSTTNGCEMHQLCPGSHKGRHNVYTELDWLVAFPDEVWEQYVENAVRKWERDDPEVENDELYFRDETDAARSHNDNFVAWTSFWGTAPAPQGKGAAGSDKGAAGSGKGAAGSGKGAAGSGKGAASIGDADGKQVSASGRRELLPATVSLAARLSDAIGHLDVVKGLVRDSGSLDEDGAHQMLMEAAKLVLEMDLLSNDLIMLSSQGTSCLLAPKAFFLFMGAPEGMRSRAVGRYKYVRYAEDIPRCSALDARVAVLSLDAKRGQLDTQRMAELNLQLASASRAESADVLGGQG
jgi:hypothetical protein